MNALCFNLKAKGCKGRLIAAAAADDDDDDGCAATDRYELHRSCRQLRVQIVRSPHAHLEAGSVDAEPEPELRFIVTIGVIIIISSIISSSSSSSISVIIIIIIIIINIIIITIVIATIITIVSISVLL